MGANYASANTIHVRQDGTGNYTTIQAAVNAMAAKDVILVGPGTYPERVTFPSGKSGVAGSLTTVMAETSTAPEMYGFDTGNCNFLHIEGFGITVPTNMASNAGINIRSGNLLIASNYIHDVLGVGINTQGYYNNNQIISNHIYHVGMSIILFGTNWMVASNDLERLTYYDPLGDADYIIFFGANHVLKGNFMHGTSASEIGPAHVDGFSSWDNNGDFIQHVRIEGNHMKDFYHEGFIVAAAYHSNSFDVIICNNIFESAAAWGVLGFNNLREVKVYNNVFINIPSNGVGINNNATGEVYNNIFYNVTGVDTATSPTIGSKNIWYVPGRTLSARFNGDLVNVNPLFVSVTNGNFHLQTNSPGIDAGVANTNCVTDIDGVSRPQGAGWDIGIYEYVSGAADTKPPVISAVTATVATTSSALISWNTDELANGRVDYGTTTNYGSIVSNAAFVLQHQFTLSNLTTGATYHYRIRSADTSTNLATSSDFSFVLAPTAPSITAQPQGLTNVVGATATFNVTANGTPPLTYQWRFNGAIISNSGQFSGATTSSLTITNLQTANAGNYQVVIGNSSGSVTSSVATLGIIVPGSCQPTPSGIVGWWPADGSVNDVVGTNNGVLQGGATANATGFSGPAFSFDGTNSYVQIADAAALRPTNLTVEAWVQFSGLDSAGTGAPAGEQYLVFKQNPSSSDFEGYALSKARTANGDVFSFALASGSGQSASVQSTTLLTTGVWYHVAAVRGSNTMQLYVNGQLQGQTNVAFAQSYGAFPLYFGTTGQSYWDRKLKGKLDEVSLYNRALTSGEIAAIYSAGSGGKCKGATGSMARFSASTKQGNNVVFTLYGLVGRSYEILSSTNMQSWSQVATVTLSNGPALVTLPVGNGKVFYRAMLLP